MVGAMDIARPEPARGPRAGCAGGRDRSSPPGRAGVRDVSYDGRLTTNSIAGWWRSRRTRDADPRVNSPRTRPGHDNKGYVPTCRETGPGSGVERRQAFDPAHLPSRPLRSFWTCSSGLGLVLGGAVALRGLAALALEGLRGLGLDPVVDRALGQVDPGRGRRSGARAPGASVHDDAAAPVADPDRAGSRTRFPARGGARRRRGGRAGGSPGAGGVGSVLEASRAGGVDRPVAIAGMRRR